MNLPRLSRFAQRLAFREWLLLICVLTLLAAGLGWQNGLGRIDQSLYDLLLSANGRPARDDILIVAIDDYSIAELGRWPWPRARHAKLLRNIADAGPRAIGLDVILSEPELAADGNRAGDHALAAALAANHLTVLPATGASRGAGATITPPIAELACAARALGHINLQLDSDGVLRSFAPHTFQDGVWWPHFALALAADLQLPAGGDCQPAFNPTEATTAVSRVDTLLRIPFAGGSGHFQSVPYVAVLRGEVPPQFLAGKYVLVGATALGMADSYPTPVSGLNGAMAGIEINANILASLLEGKSIALAAPWQTALFCALPVFLALLGYLFFSPRQSLLSTVSLLLLTLVASGLALRAGIWLAPGAALTALVLSYPLWSWRRLETAISYLGQEFMRLDQEPHLLPEAATMESAEPLADLLEQRIRAMTSAARRVRDLRQFVSDSLNSFPDAVLITAPDGRVLLTNRHAHAYLAALGLPTDQAALLPQLYAALSAPQAIDQHANLKVEWADLLDLRQVGALVNGVAAQDRNGRDLLLKSAPCYSAAGLLIGWIVNLIDISNIRAAERSRDETLRFLSHDMRAPQASILALLELQSEAGSALPQQEFFSRIEKAARKTLGLADNFVQLARAESQEYRLEEVDFQDLLLDATDEMWTLAKSREVRLETEFCREEMPVRVDRALMTRALINLISNAINYSPAAARIHCSIGRLPGTPTPQVACSISDQGYGIAPTDQARLFQRFQRITAPGQPRHDGIGLGLVFVKTVVERHGGQVTFDSQPGHGTTFRITLPLLKGQQGTSNQPGA
ncbi:MAG TPA: CHASE2 domain-containing protein [Burkholderiaceae bacterium]|nr:CHASE2 domain-containing protein [Burkholderiaceae bacterium]